MRPLLLFLLLGAVAVAIALFAKVNAGYVLIVAPPYRMELSLNAFILLAIVAFLAVYLLLRFASRLSRLPREVREHRRAQHLERTLFPYTTLFRSWKSVV